MNKEIINLNLITSYPVKWDIYKVFRDFIQNFYDSVPWNEFKKRFSYEYNEGIITMICTDVSYNYEWLLHIGGSSKTNSKKSSSGHFGEGFKIAALCGIRDFGYEIETSSNNWNIKVVENDIIIDGNITKSLAYELERYDHEKKDTTLTIKNVSLEDMEYFYSALYSFYYKGNPLIGKEIYVDKEYAIYHRSDFKKGKAYPSTFKASGEGIVFAAFQARGSLKEPLVFCQNSYVDHDRERDTFSTIDNISVLVECIERIPPKKALELLIYYENKWYTYPKTAYGYSSYYAVIRSLIFRVGTSLECIEELKRLYPKLLIARKIDSGDRKSLSIRRYCLDWIKKNRDFKLVQDSFIWLGFLPVEVKCSSLGILPEVKLPHSDQENFIRVLQECIADVFSGFFEIESLPECKVITNVKASVSGYASVASIREKKSNNYGFKYRYKLKYICIKDKYLNRESFESALTVYIHELCHCFGGDKSELFSYAMTDAMEILLRNVKKIDEYKELWNTIGK
ncbi:MAG: hypothetical protein ACRC7N_01890 [Clostridium sp.]